MVPVAAARPHYRFTARTFERRFEQENCAIKFHMVLWTARLYMRWAREHEQIGDAGSEVKHRSLREMSGATERDREQRQSAQQQAFRRVLRDVARSRAEIL
jgi:hypothetical protein